MKKIVLSALIILLSIAHAFPQSVRITSIIEGDCPTGSTAPRVIELYVDGTVDVTNLKIQFQFSFSTNWVVNNSIGAGEYTDSFLYVVNDISAFDNNFPGIRTTTNTTTGTMLSNVDGGEKIRLVDSSNNNQVVDIFGVDGENGENTTWNFSNSFVKRNNAIGPNTTFTESEWTITPKNTLLFEGVCWGEPVLNTIVGLQSFTLSNNGFVLSKNELKVFPNPAKESIILEGVKDKTNFKIYNILGVEVLDGQVNKNEQIKINTLEKGVYLIKVDASESLKFVKQ